MTVKGNAEIENLHTLKKFLNGRKMIHMIWQLWF